MLLKEESKDRKIPSARMWIVVRLRKNGNEIDERVFFVLK